MRERHAAGWAATMGGIAMLAFAPAVVIFTAIVAGVILGAKGARELGRRRRAKLMMPSTYADHPPLLDWQLQQIPIEQRDWARRNLR